MITCSIDSCNKKPKRHGMCLIHYQRLITKGDANISKKSPNGSGYLQGGYYGKQINGKRKFDHVRIAEQALGKSLPIGSVVHHANGNSLDNRNENLVICQDRAYHNLIHARLNAFNLTGDPNKKKCKYCHNYDDVINLSCCTTKKTSCFWHKSCHNKYQNNRRKNADI